MITMIAGVYGMTATRADGSTFVRGMNADSGAFSLDPEKEAYLVARGVARYVETAKAEPKSLDEMSVKELREVGKVHGLTLKVGMSKTELLAAIRAAQDEPSGEDTTGEAAPVFDAAEAVQ